MAETSEFFNNELVNFSLDYSKKLLKRELCIRKIILETKSSLSQKIKAHLSTSSCHLPSLSGRRMYYLTWFLQFTTLLLGNMGFILLGGRALKVHHYFQPK